MANRDLGARQFTSIPRASPSPRSRGECRRTVMDLYSRARSGDVSLASLKNEAAGGRLAGEERPKGYPGTSRVRLQVGNFSDERNSTGARVLFSLSLGCVRAWVRAHASGSPRRPFTRFFPPAESHCQSGFVGPAMREISARGLGGRSKRA